jgi:hypothetical protein
MIAEVGSVPGSIPHRMAAATGALYWNQAGADASCANSDAATSAVDDARSAGRETYS